MSSVENFILGLDGQQKAIVSYMHHLLTNQHDLIPKIRFKIPMYYRKKWVCYLNPIKNDGIELAFMRGYLLSNDQNLLEKKDRKYVCGIELFDVLDIPEQSINEIIQEALMLEELDSR